MRATADDARLLTAPGRYVQKWEALAEIGAELKPLSRTPLILADAAVWGLVGPTVEQSMRAAYGSAKVELFSGEATVAEMERVARLCSDAGVDMVAGIGGGKAMDTAKGAALFAGIKAASVPTIASNDAATSRMLVAYTPEGVLEQVLALPENPQLILVDTKVILGAPVRFLVSGIGDALATKFEADQCSTAGHLSPNKGRQTLAGLAIAECCYQVLRRDAPAAIRAARERIMTPALDNIIEAALLLSGMGFENGGLSTAHALTRGFSRRPECHGLAHGFEVAFGLLVQFVLENRTCEFLDDMLCFYAEVGLPTTLSDLGLHETTPELLDMLAEASLASPESHVRKMTVPVNERMLAQAIAYADSQGRALAARQGGEA